MLRELVVGGGLCDERLFVEAAAQAEADGTSILAELVRRNSVDCDELARRIAAQTNLPVLLASELVTDEDAIRTLPFDAARSFLALPLALDLDARPPRMRVALANPLDEEVRRELERLSGFRLDVALARGSDLEAAIGRAYATLITRSIPRRTSYAVTPSGRTVEPSTRPRHETEERAAAVERRLLALVELLVHKGLITAAEASDLVEPSESPGSGERPRQSS